MMFLLLREVAHGWYTSPRVPIGKFRCSIYNAGIFTTPSILFDAHAASLYSNRFYVLLHYLNVTVLLHHFWCEVLGYISCSYSCTLLLHRCMTSLMPGSLTVPELRAIHFPNSTSYFLLLGSDDSWSKRVFLELKKTITLCFNKYKKYIDLNRIGL